eukprot:GCRY01000583.1.p1 GENE.GCRY01000583.1~~GCRY01000583.1.p1  ORF type:complete len:200 (+),score=32.05 GCRY01000583.1:336-935(+)
MENHLFNLKFTSKQLLRSSKKCEKEEAKERSKLKKAIEKQNHEGARIYAENAIRQKNQALNYLKLSSRVDAVCSRLESSIRMKQVTRSMGMISNSMEKAMQSMNLEQISAVMDKFEREFDNMQVQSDVVEGAMQTTMSQSTPQNEVDSLIQQVADEHGLQVSLQLGDAAVGGSIPQEKASANSEDDLAARLAALKNPNV